MGQVRIPAEISANRSKIPAPRARLARAASYPPDTLAPRDFGRSASSSPASAQGRWVQPPWLATIAARVAARFSAAAPSASAALALAAAAAGRYIFST